jgi:HlyD family secretion protein
VNRQVLSLAALVVLAGACKEEQVQQSIQPASVERRDIVVDAEATGGVEPINVIEVKSKASGLITAMPVETGTDVRPGDLLVQVDTRDVKNQYDQAFADLRAAEARSAVVAAQRKRSDDLFAQRIITAQEHETSQLDFANAQAQLVRSRANLDLAQQRLEDATVRAPVTGTVIEKTVSIGQVITSATGAFGGGTTLLKMADLSKVRVRALVNETDIGSVRAGLPATVIVDAYPERPFRGTVEKIEPQAVVQQSVTMFPVLVSIANEEGLLKPGMNGEVSVLINRRDQVLSVPNDAVRSVREAATAAAALGLDPEAVMAQLRTAMNGGGAPSTGAAPAGSTGTPGTTPVVRAESRGEVDAAAIPAQFQGQLPSVTPAQCDSVTAALAKNPSAAGRLERIRAGMRDGTLDRQAASQQSRAVYDELGLDARTATACRMQPPGGANAAEAPRQGQRRAQGDAPRVRQGAPDPAADAPLPRNRTRAGLVFVADSGTFSPRVVRLGASNYDFTEVVSGLSEGERVALLAAATLQQRRQENVDRFQRMTGGGVPGMSRQGQQGGAGGGTGGGAAGAGGNRGGRP